MVNCPIFSKSVHSAYAKHGCRCGVCLDAHRAYYRHGGKNHLEKCKAYYEKNKKRVGEYKASWYERNKARILEKIKQNHENDPKKRWGQRMKLAYGIFPEEYDSMFLKQEGKCAICKKTPRNKLGVDHDHKTGVIRGLLCSSCNLGLGLFEDSPELFVKAKDYLEAV